MVVAVFPEYSPRGYGEVAVQDFLKKAKNIGMFAVHLYADSVNCSALRVYEKMGFSDCVSRC